MKSHAIFLLLMMLRTAYGESGSPSACGRDWASWRREYPLYTAENGPKGRARDSDTAIYHLILIKSDDTCRATVMEFPAFINEKGKDTAYSASDGGFRNGAGSVSMRDGRIAVEGKYTRAYYTGIGPDSSLKYMLVPKAGKFRDEKTGLVFSEITDSARTRMLGKWGITESRRKPGNGGK